MLRDKNGHDDQDNKDNDQARPPDAAASCGKVPWMVRVRHLIRCARAADRQFRAAHLAGVLGSVAAGPREAAVPWGRVGAAEGCREAQAFPVAGPTVPTLVRATDRSLDHFLAQERSLGCFAPLGWKKPAVALSIECPLKMQRSHPDDRSHR
jgi:hypothetical protein